MLGHASTTDASVQSRSAGEALALHLARKGFVHLPERFASRADAWARATSVAMHARAYRRGAGASRPLEVVGEFNLPAAGVDQRDYQALHMDFGVPRLTAQTVDIALYTGLYIDQDREGSGASTRLVPLDELAKQRAWPGASVVADRIRSAAHDNSPSEGILARIVECVDLSWDLPAKDSDFLCGMEFGNIHEEHTFYRRHQLELDAAEQVVTLAPGELLILDNLAIAHGRIGRRATRELWQLCLGLRSAEQSVQAEVLEAVAARFATTTAASPG
ncbi:MAG TPA: hypothetical protein VG708_02800 [Mycobacteriales bacterium]|nr:hypothetical protein [Mycobacteriales bacterium]